MKNTKDLFLKLRMHPQDPKLVSRAMDWLSEHPDHQYTERIFKIAVLCNLDAKMISWTKTWFDENLEAKCNLIHLFAEKLNPTASEELIEQSKEFVHDPNIDPNFKVRLALNLIQSFKESDFIRCCENFISENSTSTLTPVVIRGLAETLTSPHSIELASRWFELNKHDWYSNVMLATILDKQASSGYLEEAISRLKDSSNFAPEVLLLVHPIIRTGHKTRLREVINNASTTLEEVVLKQAFELDPEFFANDFINALESGNCQKNVEFIEFARHWAQQNPSEKNQKKILALTKTR